MSIITWVGWVAISVIAPLVPAGTMTAFAVIAPVGALSVDDPGCGDPAGHALRKPSTPDGTTVIFVAYAWAPAGTPQLLDNTAKSRVTLAASAGPPKVPVTPRVSAMRHGVSG